jgi:hypothetical protein
MQRETVRLDERRAWHLLTTCVVFLARRLWRKWRGAALASAVALVAGVLLAVSAILWVSSIVHHGVHGAKAAAMKAVNPRDLQTPGP